MKEDYERSKELGSHNSGNSFEALIMAAVRQERSDDDTRRLERAFPDIVGELKRRHNASGGILPEDACMAEVEITVTTNIEHLNWPAVEMATLPRDACGKHEPITGALCWRVAGHDGPHRSKTT